MGVCYEVAAGVPSARHCIGGLRWTRTPKSGQDRRPTERGGEEASPFRAGTIQRVLIRLSHDKSVPARLDICR